MQYHKQLILHDAAKGLMGDCFRTCIACLLDMEPQRVPHFFAGEGISGDQGFTAANEWLSPKGFQLASVCLSGESILDDVLGMMARHNPQARYMLVGQSRLEENHVVIFKGGRIIHDPSPRDTGIVGPAQPEGVYWLYFLVLP